MKEGNQKRLKEALVLLIKNRDYSERKQAFQKCQLSNLLHIVKPSFIRLLVNKPNQYKKDETSY